MIRLYETPALEAYHVAEDGYSGERWLVPKLPLGPAALEERRPYTGSHTLKQVKPAIERLYQPRGKSKTRMISFAVTPQQGEDLDQRAADIGLTRSQYIRRMCLL